MAAFISSLLFYTSTGVASLIFVAYLYSQYHFGYFKRRKIPFEPPSFPFGNLLPVVCLKRPYSMVLSDMYYKYKSERFVGFFQLFQKSVLITDRELIKHVLVKDFEYFDGRNTHYNRDLEPLTANLFSVDGQEWKILRMKMSPTFSSVKLKAMFETIVKIGFDLRDYLAQLCAENEVIECKGLFIRYGLAIIASTAFGLESDVLTDKSSMFFKISDAITTPTFDGMYRNALFFYAKDIARIFRLRIVPKVTHDYIMNLVKDTIHYRETEGNSRNDFLQVLMQLKNGTKIGDQDYSITINELAAQCYAFIVAGFETNSNAMSFFLYEMALNPEVQKSVQQEVDAVEEITYDSVTGMEYLDMAIDETLRKYAPLGFVGRQCSRDYVVPGTEHVIEKGTHVLVSTHGLHWDPDLFPNPEKFIPERFSKENKSDIKPFSYMPFGEGPRFCIGMRFGKLSMKTGLALLMKRYEVRPAHNPPVPLEFEVKSINTMAKGGTWLQFVDRRNTVPVDK